MKQILFIAVIVTLFACAGNAQERGFGLGVIVGEPTGVSAKGWISPRSAFDVGLAWSFRREGYINAHMDYLWHFRDVVNTSQSVIPYLGLGGRIGGYRGSAIAGVRVVGGIAWWPEDTPIDIFLELAPVVDLAPETQMSVNGGIGVRLFFH